MFILSAIFLIKKDCLPQQSGERAAKQSLYIYNEVEKTVFTRSLFRRGTTMGGRNSLKINLG